MSYKSLAMRAGLLALCVGAALEVPAQTTVYKCEKDGKVTYTDEPCLQAKKVDVTLTQGLDSWTGARRTGADVERAQRRDQIADALRPLGVTRESFALDHKRARMTPVERAECAALDASLPVLERREAATSKEEKSQAQADLLKARKRFKHLAC